MNTKERQALQQAKLALDLAVKENDLLRRTVAALRTRAEVAERRVETLREQVVELVNAQPEPEVDYLEPIRARDRRPGVMRKTSRQEYRA